MIEHPTGADRYREAIPEAVVTVVRLNVPMDLVLARLAVRESGESLKWSRSRAPELQEIMERAGVGDLVIDVGARDPQAVANEIASRLKLVPETLAQG